MHVHTLLTCSCLFVSVVSQTIPELLSNVTKSSFDAKVVPDVIATLNLTAFVNMTFTTDSESMTPSPGERLTMLQTSLEPRYFIVAENTTALKSYGNLVLIMVDPDAPAPQNTSTSQVIHLLAGNFTSCPSGSMLMNTSEAFMEYWQPRPQAGSDPHRYILFIYPQPPSFDSEVAPFFEDLANPRMGFKLSTFTSRMSLGEPIGGNFFIVGPNQISITTGTSTLPSTTTIRARPTLTPLSGAAYGNAAMSMTSVGFSMATLLFTLP